MAEYIDRQAVIDAVQQHREGVLGGYEYDEGVAFVYAAAHNHIIDVIKHLPSSDVQPIVRCKDCKNSYVFEPWEGINATRYCKIFKNHYGDSDFCVNDDDFCSFGERKDGEQDETD